MGRVKKITLTMENDEDVEFFPSFDCYLSITRGHREKKTAEGIMNGIEMFPVVEPNGNEVLLLVCAPSHIKQDIVNAAVEVIDRVIND
jgi:hypothetical protein